MTMRLRVLENLILVLAASAFLPSCYFIGSEERGEQLFTKEEVKKIEPGRTTKDEILKWLGPPVAIARKGESGKAVPLEDVRTGGFAESSAATRASLPVAIAEKGESGKAIPLDDLRTDGFLELFAGKHVLTEDHVVYYYRNTSTKGITGVFFGVVGGRTRKVNGRLWVLVNNRNGIVEDYIVREQE